MRKLLDKVAQLQAAMQEHRSSATMSQMYHRHLNTTVVNDASSSDAAKYIAQVSPDAINRTEQTLQRQLDLWEEVQVEIATLRTTIPGSEDL